MSSAAARAIRTCLKRGCRFDSRGPHNRICLECKHVHWSKDCKLVRVDDYMPRTATMDLALRATIRAMAGERFATKAQPAASARRIAASSL